jgi:hypothetical protein
MKDRVNFFKVLSHSSIRTEFRSFNLMIISLLMSLLLEHMPSLWITNKENGNPPRGPSADWWVLTTANAAGTNGLTCLPKHGGAQDKKFLATYPMTDQSCLTYAIAR